jgi:hypothetical protein
LYVVRAEARPLAMFIHEGNLVVVMRYRNLMEQKIQVRVSYVASLVGVVPRVDNIYMEKGG